jgi:hypothetical protein
MTIKVQVLLDEVDREAFRAMAKREGLSLSAWLRKAGKEKLSAKEQSKPIYDKDSLERFFVDCDAQALGNEPNWEDHLKVITRSKSSGQADL